MTKFGRTYADLLHEYRWIVLVVVVVLFVLAIFGNNFKIGPFEFGTHPDKVDTTDNGNRNITGGQNNINGNNNVNVSNNGDTYVIPNYNTPKEQNEFSITGTANSRLIKRLENSKVIVIVSNSPKIIDVSYTGTVAPFEGNMYYYSGGNVVLTINGICYHEFKEFKIDQMRPNPKNRIVEEIDKVINYYVETNLDLFSNKIIECIRK